MLIIILLPDFCPLKPEIARFSGGFCLNVCPRAALRLHRSMASVVSLSSIRPCSSCMRVDTKFKVPKLFLS